VSAAKARGISTKAADDDHTGLEAVDEIRARAGEPDRWVIALGTNDAFIHSPERYEAEIGLLLDRIGAGRHVLWIDVALPDEPAVEAAWNGALAAVATARPADLTVIPWSATAGAHPDWFATDQIHLTPAGYHARAAAVAEAAADPAVAEAAADPAVAGAADADAADADAADSSDTNGPATTTTAPAPTRRDDTQAIRSMLVSRSVRE
jgi:lysophospholipase L1-like esterase